MKKDSESSDPFHFSGITPRSEEQKSLRLLPQQQQETQHYIIYPSPYARTKPG